MDSPALSNEIAVARVATLVGNMMSFWKNSSGWAPLEAASLMNKSMLEWQSSLADALKNWNRPLTDGELILAWANVGAIVEGQLKLFLSVYYDDYVADVEAIKKKGQLVEPDSVALEQLRVYFKKNIWGPSEDWDEWILMVLQRRNAIHAYKHKDIGTSADLHASFHILLEFVRSINGRLPYPDDIYVPREY
ncbi:MAG: hypothetical protein M0R41_15975 [Methylobacter tundripaludum]|nr:hypothetical protein [Methylobacter tundripaludum]